MAKRHTKYRMVLLLSLSALLFLTLGTRAAWAALGASLGSASASYKPNQNWLQVVSDAAIVGDVNGDGFDDILFAASGALADESPVTGAYLVLGGAIGWAMDTRLDDVAIAFYPESDADQITAVAGAGDVNGDGFADMLVGAPAYPGDGSNRGRAYLILGSATITSQSLAGVAVIKYTGDNPNDHTGSSLAGAGDVDGDGFDDFVIGSAEYAGTNGAAHLALGSGAPTGTAVSGLITYLGEALGDAAGTSVAGAGDVNGDGYADFLVGAPYQDAGGTDIGAAYLILGSSTPAGAPLGSGGAIIRYIGSSSFSYTGASVAGAGDVNGDGYGDFLVGEPGFGTPLSFQSYAVLVFGGAAPFSQVLSNANGMIEYTAATDASLGAGVAGAGDVDGDGYDDILMAAPEDIIGSVRLGAAFFVSGRSALSGVLLSDPAATRYHSESSLAKGGTYVDGGGDVNGDGFADFLVGSEVEAADNTSMTYLFLGRGPAAGQAPYRHRARLLGNAGNARPARFDQAGVRADFTLSADVDGEVWVDRYSVHPCDTNIRLTMPIWTLDTNKASATIPFSDITVRFNYTDSQIAGLVEADLKVWSRPVGDPCGAWTQVPNVTVDSTHNFVYVNNLLGLGRQYTLATAQPNPTGIGLTGAGTTPASRLPLGAAAVAGLLLTAGTADWYLRRRKEF